MPQLPAVCLNLPTQQAIMTQAFLGTGLLGTAFTRALLQRGIAVQVWNRTFERAEPLATYGATVCRSAAEAVAGAAHIHVTLKDDASVDEVLEGACSGFTPGAIIIDIGDGACRFGQVGTGKGGRAQQQTFGRFWIITAGKQYQVGGTVKINNGFECGQLAGTSHLKCGHFIVSCEPGQGSQVATCRKSHEGKLIGIKTILSRVAVQPADGGIAILYLRRKNGLCAEAVVYGSKGKTAAQDLGNRLFHVAHISILVVAEPAAAMYPNHQGQLACCIGWQVNIQQVFVQGVVVIGQVGMQHGTLREKG